MTLRWKAAELPWNLSPAFKIPRWKCADVGTHRRNQRSMGSWKSERSTWSFPVVLMYYEFHFCSVTPCLNELTFRPSCNLHLSSFLRGIKRARSPSKTSPRKDSFHCSVNWVHSNYIQISLAQIPNSNQFSCVTKLSSHHIALFINKWNNCPGSWNRNHSDSVNLFNRSLMNDLNWSEKSFDINRQRPNISTSSRSGIISERCTVLWWQTWGRVNSLVNAIPEASMRTMSRLSHGISRISDESEYPLVFDSFRVSADGPLSYFQSTQWHIRKEINPHPAIGQSRFAKRSHIWPSN